MKTIVRNIQMAAPVESVFGYIIDPLKTPEWLPSMMSVENVAGKGVGKTWNWVYQMAGLDFKGSSECTEFAPNERYAYRSKGGIRSTWTYELKPLAQGTDFRLVVDYEIPVPVLGRLAEPLLLKRNEREATLAMENLKELVEARVLART